MTSQLAVGASDNNVHIALSLQGGPTSKPAKLLYTSSSNIDRLTPVGIRILQIDL